LGGGPNLLAPSSIGATVLIGELNMHVCLGLASHVTVIDKGQITHARAAEAPKANDHLRRRYLA
jgi:branched-chain amino acid transport system ATP-binding protein